MSEERAALKVTIFENEYTIRGEAKEEYIQTLARYVDNKMKTINQETHLADPLKISILAAINMADEIYRLQTHLHEVQKANPPQQQLIPDFFSVAPEAISALSAHIDAALKEEEN